MTGGAASGQKGTARERELVRRFHDAGWGAIRLGGSGSGTDADLPDVLAGRSTGSGTMESYVDGYPWESVSLTQAVAVELKSGKATTHYVQQAEVEALERFAQQWGARPFLGARFTTQGSGTETWLVAPEDARGPTDAGRYGLPVADVAERASVAVSDDGVDRLTD